MVKTVKDTLVQDRRWVSSNIKAIHRYRLVHLRRAFANEVKLGLANVQSELSISYKLMGVKGKNDQNIRKHQ
jgi:hypothetical protein